MLFVSIDVSWEVRSTMQKLIQDYCNHASVPLMAWRLQRLCLCANSDILVLSKTHCLSVLMLLSFSYFTPVVRKSYPLNFTFFECSVSLTKKSGFISWHTLAWIWLYRELEFPPWNADKSNLKDTPLNCAQFKMTVCLLMPGTVKLVYCVIVFNMWNI